MKQLRAAVIPMRRCTSFRLFKGYNCCKETIWSRFTSIVGKTHGKIQFCISYKNTKWNI